MSVKNENAKPSRCAFENDLHAVRERKKGVACAMTGAEIQEDELLQCKKVKKKNKKQRSSVFKGAQQQNSS